MVPSGEIFRRPSSVRWMTSASTPIRSGCARMCAASARFCGSSMNSAARTCARTSAATTAGFFSDQSCLHRQHLLRRTDQNIRDEMQDMADAEIDRDGIPGRADAERIDMTVGETVHHVRRRQHHQTHVFVGIDAAGGHPEPQLIIVGRERKRHAERQGFGAALAPRRDHARQAPARSPSDRTGRRRFSPMIAACSAGDTVIALPLRPRLKGATIGTLT